MRTPWWARPLRSSRVSLSLSQAAGRELSGELRIDDRLPRYLSEGATPQSALHIITRRSTANLQRCSNAHSPKCLEVEFSEVRSLRFACFLEEAEPPSHVARGRGLQDERRDHGEGNQGDRDLRTLHAAGEQQARHGSRDDPRVAGPAEEGEFLPRPASAPIREQAGEDGHWPRHEDEDGHRQQPAEQALSQSIERQVHAERDEYPEHGDL